MPDTKGDHAKGAIPATCTAPEQLTNEFGATRFGDQASPPSQRLFHGQSA
jgi:hypothetical protein